MVLIAALSKGEKFELVIQKATELGVTSVEPVYTHRTDIRSQPGRDERKVGRWRKIALEACKQSGRSRVPTILPPADLAEALARRREALCLVMDPEGAAPDPDWMQRLAGPDSAALAVGPEGGWSPEERVAFHGAGFHALRLGPRVLRTETAAIVSTGLLQFLVGDLGTGPKRKAHPDAIRDS